MTIGNDATKSLVYNRLIAAHHLLDEVCEFIRNVAETDESPAAHKALECLKVLRRNIDDAIDIIRPKDRL